MPLKSSLFLATVNDIATVSQCTKITLKSLEIALEFELHLILSERSMNLNLRLSLKIKSFTK